MMNRGSEDGYVALELALGIGVLVLPVLILVSLLPTWFERQSLARVAAQEAARTVVLAETWEEGVAGGMEVVSQVAANHGLEDSIVDIAIEGALVRGETVTANVTVEMPALVVPLMGSVGAWEWTASHSEKVDQYRSFDP
jgi:hypothetical protein